MKIENIMSRGVACVESQDTLQDAAKKMADCDVGVLPVTNGDKVIGTITDRDITVRAVARGDTPGEALVSSAMSKPAICCYEDQEVSEALDLMQRQNVARLPVLDRQEHLVGLVSLGDFALTAAEEGLENQVLEAVSANARRHEQSFAAY